MTIGIDDSKFFLVDYWPGAVTVGTNPADFTTPTAAEVFSVGTKRAIYDDTNNGWAILCFLKYDNGAGTVAVATVKSICGIDTAKMATAGAWATVTNDGSGCELTGPIAIALATMTDEYYGWFWIGGVCPVDTISGLDGIFLSDASITAGVWMVLADSASIAKFHLAAATDAANFSAFSMEADTTA